MMEDKEKAIPTKKHPLRRCKCGRDECGYCNKTLKVCKVCGGVNESLPTECPGKKMSAMLEACVLAEYYDFYESKWHDLRGKQNVE